MRVCHFCGKTLPLTRIHRTWKERHITHRKGLKYQCTHCKNITFLSSK